MTAEEVLQTMTETYAEPDNILTIDNDLRTITIPPGLTNIGVESDDGVHRLHFRMPRQYGEFDLSEFDIRINYLNANNEGDKYAVLDKSAEEDYIDFSWLVGRHALAYRGNVTFIVCLRKSEGDTVEKEFNTTVATLPVLEGLETTEQVIQEYPDALEEILRRLDDLEENGGGSGTPGKDGREVELQKSSTAIQWRYVGEEAWKDLVQLSEITGATPNLQIGEVETLEPGEAATATITGTPENPLLNLGIPKGETGGGEGGGGITEETDPTVPAWAKEPTKPTYTAVEVGADASGTAEAKVSVHNTAVDAHSDIRLLVQELTTRLNALADSDDDTLDQMSEIVAYIKSNKSLIDAITTQKVSVTDIIDNLTTNVANKPLSAAQGVALKALIDGITIPEALPNPQKLIFTGAVTGEYDGSTEQTVNIPESSGSSADIPRQEMQNTDTTVTLDPNKLYVFPEMASLAVTLGTPSDTNVANEYHFFFTSGATATTLTLNDVLSDAYSIEANMKYEVSILEGVAYIKGVAVSAA